MSTIQRIEGLPLFSRVVIHNSVVYMSGIVPKDRTDDVKQQTRDVLAQIDTYLAQAGVDKTRLLTSQIWLKNIDRDFAAMNEVWLEWVDPNHLPTRVTCESNLASADILVEILVTAAAN